MAQVKSQPGSVTFRTGGVSMDRASVAYQGVEDPFAGSGGASSPAASSWLSLAGYELILTPGWYVIAMSARIVWGVEANAPHSLGLYMQGGWNAIHNDTSVYARASLGTSLNPAYGIRQVMSSGPTFVNSGDSVWAECTASGGAPAADNDAAGSYLTWNITKLG